MKNLLKLYFKRVYLEEKFFKSGKIYPFLFFNIFFQTVPYIIWGEKINSDFLALHRIISIFSSSIVLFYSYILKKDTIFIFYLYTISLSFSFIITPFFSFCLFEDKEFWIMNLIFSLCTTVIISMFLSQIHSLIFSIVYILVVSLLYGISLGNLHFLNILYGLIILLLNIFIFSRNKQTQNDILLNNMKSIAGLIIHEIRTPLSSLEMEIYKNIYNKKYKERSSNILKILKRIKVMLNMFSSEVFYNESKINKTENSISNIISEALETYPFDNIDKDLVVVDVSDAYIINCDKDIMIQILYNLIKNALYEIKKHKRGKIFISSYIENEKNKLLFKDSVGSLNKKNMNNIFYNFISMKKEGMGLGLSFVKDSLEGQGYSIHCKVDEEKFTKFFITF